MTSFAVQVHKLLKAQDQEERGCPEICTIVRDLEWQCHVDFLWCTSYIAHVTVAASDSEAEFPGLSDECRTASDRNWLSGQANRLGLWVRL